jgi:hypothetical protein
VATLATGLSIKTTTSHKRIPMSYLQDYLEKMRLNAQEINHQVQLKNEATSNSPRQYKPLTDQIIELMKSTPPSLLNRPWTMTEFVARLDGKYRDRPHAQNVGDALRRFGWKSIRHWGKGYNGVRLWIPPV